MISDRMQKELNNQINKELFSAYFYLSMEAYFHSVNLLGFANWMHVQVQEELTHAQKFYNFLNERGGRVLLTQIDTPGANWNSPLAVFEETLQHEEFVTDSINNLVNIAVEEKDHATNIFLQWFVTEQVEEEASVNEVINNLKLIKDQPGSLFILDKELAQRQFVPPPAV